MTIVQEKYSSCGRTLMYPMPPQFEDWGFEDEKQVWQYDFCVIDDFGNAVPSYLWPYGKEDNAYWDFPHIDPTPVTYH